MTGADGHGRHGSELVLWVGTYPAGGAAPGAGEGIWRVTLNLGTGALSGAFQLATTAAPSFLTWGPGGLLYATNEEVEGRLSVWRPTSDSLEQVGVASTGGTHPCHVHVDERTGAALVANYTSGSLAVIELDSDGLPVADAPQQLFAFEGSGPHPGRQQGPHAHYVLPAGDHVLVSDLGADVIRRFVRDPAHARLSEDGVAVRLPAGAGPRHAAFAADGTRLYVVGELDGRLHTIAWDAGSATGSVVASDPVDPAADPTNPAHLVLAPGSLLIGARGPDSIVSHRLDARGRPTFQDRLKLAGSWPRHHALVDDRLVVAQQKRGGVVAMTLDGRVTGVADVPSPACVLPASVTG